MLTLDTLSKRYPNGTLALGGISLQVRPGEILGIVGGSGCGKSTLLRTLAGLESPTSGAALFDGQPITGPREEIGFVFQEPRLLPWLTVRGNIAFGLRHLPKPEQEVRVGEALQRVGLAAFADAWPRELSGGMAQRAALARALVTRPAVLLLDEPFSALDALTRYDLQDHLLDLWAYDRPTMILVTHDIEEALALSDRVVVMQPSPGRVHSTLTVSLPQPRDRTSAPFESLKRQILAGLGGSRRAHPPAAGQPLHAAAP